MSVPVIVYDHAHAARAYDVHAALVKAEARNPTLRDNPQWTILRADAYDRFAMAFAVIK